MAPRMFRLGRDWWGCFSDTTPPPVSHLRAFQGQLFQGEAKSKSWSALPGSPVVVMLQQRRNGGEFLLVAMQGREKVRWQLHGVEQKSISTCRFLPQLLLTAACKYVVCRCCRCHWELTFVTGCGTALSSGSEAAPRRRTAFVSGAAPPPGSCTKPSPPLSAAAAATAAPTVTP